VTIARALANSPEIMLLDEPTGDLDTKNTDLVMKILLDLNRDGITMIMVTHDLNLKNYAHRVIRIADGKVPGEEHIDLRIRERYVAELDERVNNPGKEKLTIREGADYAPGKDMREHEQEVMERYPVKPSALTAVRAPEDYQIVRFAMADRAPHRRSLDLAKLAE
jgi:energy-coupling factor transporter ATP-binding protein EcfA2